MIINSVTTLILDGSVLASVIEFFEKLQGQVEYILLVDMLHTNLIYKAKDFISPSFGKSSNVKETGVGIPITKPVYPRLDNPELFFSFKKTIILLNEVFFKRMNEITMVIVTILSDSLNSSKSVLNLMKNITKGVLILARGLLLDEFNRFE